MICFPNAKINLGLNIISKRTDGYHDLETIFYPIQIKDALEIIVSNQSEDSFIESGQKVGISADSNLVMKALKLMRDHFDIPIIEVHLLKKIPFGAGIGGGSADATFMLKLLNDKFSLGANDDLLAQLARKLGADCPFFINNRPAFASGIGEVLEDVPLCLDNYFFVLVKPNIHVSTKEAFSMIQPQTPDISLKEIIQRPINEWRYCMKNDFEESIFPQFPEIAKIKERLYSLGALYSSMSGSGSSVYGIFETKVNIKHHFPDSFVWEQK